MFYCFIPKIANGRKRRILTIKVLDADRFDMYLEILLSGWERAEDLNSCLICWARS